MLTLFFTPGPVFSYEDARRSDTARFARHYPAIARTAPAGVVTALDVTLLKFLIFLKQFKKALAPRIDRWIREDVWGGLLFLKKVRRARRLEARQERQRRLLHQPQGRAGGRHLD